MLILSLLHDFRGTWQAHKQRLCGGLIRRCAACRWLVSVPALPTNRWRLNVNQGEIKHAAPTAGLTCILQSVQITKKKSEPEGRKTRTKTLSFTVNVAEMKKLFTLFIYFLFTGSEAVQSF